LGGPLYHEPMLLFPHIIITSYFVLATAAVKTAPSLLLALSVDMAPTAAGLVFLGLAFAHLIFTQSERNRRLV